MIGKGVVIPVFATIGLAFGAAVLAALPAPTPTAQASAREQQAQFVVTAASSAQQSPAEVKIDNFSFGPQNITVPAGATVTWTNRDDIPHTVVSNDKVFKSKVLDTDQTFSFKFDKPGTYAYFCSVHPKMTGKVTVQ